MSKSTPSAENFRRRLVQARQMRKLSQEGLAKRAGLQASAVSHFETGSRKPSFDNLRRLADALDITTDYLLGRVSDSQAFAGGQRLHRHLHQLSSHDLEIAEGFLDFLAQQAREQRGKK